jgi:soluble lytic murein transglycosylase-like protein
VTATLSGWQAVQQGPLWVPVINSIEAQYGIPPNLLARIAYQESRFRPDVITGSTVSSAGALGIMQLMPQYFHSVNVPRPYSPDDTTAQITEAAQLLANLYAHFGDWSLAIAAYNDGQGNIDAYLAGSHALPQQTTDYVSQVLADVPVASNALLA